MGGTRGSLPLTHGNPFTFIYTARLQRRQGRAPVRESLQSYQTKRLLQLGFWASSITHLSQMSLSSGWGGNNMEEG